MKFRLFTRTRDKPVNRTAGSSYSFLMGGSTAGKNVNERSAMQMTAVYACVRILSEAIAGLPLHLYKYNEDGSKTKAFEARPVYVHNEDSIEAHFLSCFVSLLILRLLEQKTEYKIPIRTMVDSLRKANLSQLPDGNYMNTYCDNIIADIGKALDLELTRKFYSKKNLVTERGKTVKKF